MTKKNEISTKKYVEKYLYIKNKTGETQLLKLNKPQAKYYKAIDKLEKANKPVRIIILKARQQGFSTATEAYIFKKTSTQFNRNSGIVAHIDEATNNLFNMSKFYYNSLIAEMRPQLKASNAKVLEFDNKDNTGLRSKITCMTAGGSGVGRSYTYHYLHISEYAFWTGDKKATLNGLMQSVPNLPNTAVIIESTANGYDHFKELWDMAVAGENDFIPIFSAWWELDDYRMPYYDFELSDEEVELKKKYNLDNEQLTWRRWCIKNNCGGDKELFKQEFPSCPEEAFLTSGNCIFDQEILLNRIRQVDNIPHLRGNFTYDIKSFENTNDYTLENIKFQEDSKGYFKIFKTPEIDSFYTIGGDTAGAGSDNFVAQVIDRTTGEQVAVLCHKYNEDLFAKQLYCIGKYYNLALIGVESNFSPYTNYELQKMRYPKMYISASVQNYTHDISKSYGVRMTGGAGGVRELIISTLVELVREEVYLINDADTLREMLTFIKNEKTQKAEAQQGCFLPNTKVISVNSQCEPIDNIQKGNFVLSHKGEYRQVVNKFERNYKGKVYDIKISGIPERINATEEHPIYVYRNNSFEWIEAKNLKIKDKVLLPKRKGLSKNNYSDEMLYLMGLWLAEGSTIRGNVINFTFNITETDYANKVKQIIDSLDLDETITVKDYINHNGKVVKGYSFKNRINGKTRIAIRKNKNITEVQKTNKALHDLFIKELGKYCDKKQLSPELFNSNNLLPLVAGLIDGDGHARPKYPYDVTLSLTSKVLIEQVRQILLDNGIYCTYQVSKRENSKDIYILNIKYKYAKKLCNISNKIKNIDIVFREINHATELDDYFAVPIRDIKEFDYDGTVYNMEVDKDNTYTANGIVVHNCHDDRVMALGIAHFIKPQQKVRLKPKPQPTIWEARRRTKPLTDEEIFKSKPKQNGIGAGDKLIVI